MKTVSDQIKHERSYVEDDAARYYTRQDRLRDKQLGDQVDSANYVIRSGVLDVAVVLERFANEKTKGIGGKYNQLLKRLAARIDRKGEVYYDYGALAFIGLQVVFQLMNTQAGGAKLSSVAHTIATRVEADHKARLFEAHEPAYFNTVMKSFDEQLVQQYQHKHRVIMMKFNEFQIKWQDWDTHEKVQTANRILVAILTALPDIFFKHTRKVGKNKSLTVIDTTPAADEWFAEFEKERGFMKPLHPPMLVQPRKWHHTDYGIDGGYYTPRMTQSLPFVKTRTQAHKDFVAQYPMTEHMDAINKMQATPWRINKNVLAVQQEMFSKQLGNGLPNYIPRELPTFPEHIAPIDSDHWTDEMKDEVQTWKVISKRIHTQNRFQKGRVLAYKTIADTARSYADLNEFYFVYNADFRGRIYCATNGLSPQGEDLAKSLLQFAEGVPHGENGLYWLAVHGANTYGIDKVSNNSRVEWVLSQSDILRRVAADAISTREYWGAADKPWQFLSFVFEWARTDFGNNPDAPGFIPIGLDGSCNGLQHYSAMLRDSVGARAVNLNDSELPRDIYGEVADELLSIIREEEPSDTAFIQREWLNSKFDRKLTKRPVMTLPYGSTKQSAKEYVYDWMLDNRTKFQCDDRDLFKYAIWLTPRLWRAIGNVVIAARAAMDWLQQAGAQTLRERNIQIRWVSPAGFPVFQSYMKKRTVRITTMLAGSVDAKLKVSSSVDTDQIDKNRQKLGIAPNFVHSLDSSHMVKVINATNFSSYAMIHDDFGTHAGRTEELWTAIREEFVDMYTKYEPLGIWLEYQELDEPPELPPRGDFDIEEVRKSTYFFG